MRLNVVRSSKSKQTGALLIESMVAIAGFSIALLSLSGLQISSSKNSLSSAMRTESAIAISEVVDRMRSNVGGVREGNYNVAYGVVPTGTDQSGADVRAWLDRVANSSFRAVNAQGQIACTQPDPLSEARDCAVSVRWNDSQAEDQYQDEAIGSETESPAFELLVNVNI